MTSAIFYVCSEGNKGRALPHDFEVPRSTVYRYFRKWEAAGTWEAINEQLVMLRRQRSGADPRPGILVVGSQSTKNSATATEETGVDGGKKIKGRKDLILTDSQGKLLYTRTLAANNHDGPPSWQWWEEVLGTTELLGRVHTIRGDTHFGGCSKTSWKRQPGSGWRLALIRNSDVQKRCGRSKLKQMMDLAIVRRSGSGALDARQDLIYPFLINRSSACPGAFACLSTRAITLRHAGRQAFR